MDHIALIAFNLAILGALVSPGPAILANHVALEILFYGALAIGLTVPAFRYAYLRCKSVFDRAAAAMLGTLALRIVTDR